MNVHVGHPMDRVRQVIAIVYLGSRGQIIAKIIITMSALMDCKKII